MSAARAQRPAHAMAFAMLLAAVTGLGAQEPPDTTKPAPSKFPGRIVTVDHTPMGSVRTTDVVITPTVCYVPVQAGQVHVGGAVGLRFALVNEDGRLNIRLDHGWARGGSGTYVAVGEVF